MAKKHKRDDDPPSENDPSRSDRPTPSPPSPYGNCPNVSSRYEKLGRIGEGTYGVVYKARDRRNGAIVALKRCLPHHETSDGFPVTTLREIRTLRELRGAGKGKDTGIVELKEVAVSSSRSGVFLVFEYCEHDLANLVDAHYRIKGRSAFKEGEVKRLAMQLLNALSFLHSRHIIHRDIKLSNLLYNHRGQLRLADFGLSRKTSLSPLMKCTAQLTPNVVSLWYRPPEIFFGWNQYDDGVDNWGVGCVIAELLMGTPLIKGKNDLDQIAKMFQLLGPPNLKEWPELNRMPLIKNGQIRLPNRDQTPGTSLRDRLGNISFSGLSLLKNLLRYDPQTRLSSQDGLTARYFREVPLPTPVSLMPTFPAHEKTV